MKNCIADLYSKLTQPDTEPDWNAVTDYFQKFGFSFINYGVVEKNSGEVLGFYTNMRPDWMNYYMESAFGAHDPWARYASLNHQPLLFSSEQECALEFERGTTSETVVNETVEEGVKMSLCLPMHNTRANMINGFNLCSDMGDVQFRNMVDEHGDDIYLAAALVDSVFSKQPISHCSYGSWVPNQHSRFMLNEREVEVLRWLSEGYRNDRIADKMNIAPVTVNYHIQAIKQKLGTKTREQSVALAFQNGFLR